MSRPQIKTTTLGASLSGALVYDTIESLWQERESLIAAGDKIDVAEVTDIDSAGLAFLVEIYRMRTHKKRSSYFLNMPEQMVKISKACGLDIIFSPNADEVDNESIR